MRQGGAEAVPLQEQERLPDPGKDGGDRCQGPLQEAGVEPDTP